MPKEKPLKMLKSQGFEGGASSGVRPSASLAPADCVLARRSRPRTTRCSKPHRGFSLTLEPLPRIHRKQNETENPSRFLWCIFRGSTVCLACAGRLLPRPAKPASDHSLFKASQGLFAYARALAGSNPRIHKKQNKTERSVSFSLVHLQGFEPWTP